VILPDSIRNYMTKFVDDAWMRENGFFLVEGKDVTTPLAEVMVRRVHTVHLYDEVGVLPQLFERGEVAIVIDDDRQVTGVLTKLDYIEFISQRAKLGTAVQGSAAAGS
jgi:predicted transcriptional regulator